MKIVRSLITHPALNSLVPVLLELDSAALCLMHRKSSKAGIANLGRGECYGADQTLSAIRSSGKSRNIEGERRRLLLRKSLLTPAGPFDAGITIAAACAISKSPRQAALLASLVKAFGSKCIVELGTNVGISSAYLASATAGRVVTLEASSARAELARELHANLGIKNVEYVAGLFEDTLHKVLAAMPEVDFAFVDGHHEYEPTLHYFNLIADHAQPGAVFVFDDIRWSEGMNKAWTQLQADERFGLVVDFWTMGVGVLRADERSRIVTEPITCY